MPSIQENVDYWNSYGWPAAGEEWSEVWGGAANQWWGSLYPRIKQFLPADTILEIAPGYGRFTDFLQGFAQRLIGVDLAKGCVDACRERFADRPHVAIEKNDGYSLAMVPDDSVDFAFSFDSLVHAEADVLEAYVTQLAAKLKPNGVAFIHHSNLGAFQDSRGELTIENRHWRAPTMSAKRFIDFCAAAGLQASRQEIVNWGCDDLTDCFSIAALPASTFAQELQVWENGAFMTEATTFGQIQKFYAGQ